jgi:4-hydroxy-tetrahydrodipicolinate synthase
MTVHQHKPPSATKLPPSGIVVPLLTPLNRDGDLDRAATARLVEYVIAGRVNGLFVLGSSGEGDSLSLSTQYEFAELVAVLADGRVPLMLGAMYPSTATAIDFIKGCGCLNAYDSVVAGVPYYRFLTCEDEVVAHFREIHLATGKPVIVYNLPHPASRILTADISLSLMQQPWLVGFKDSSGRLDCVKALTSARNNRPEAVIYQGDPARSLEALVSGCAGLIPGPGNFIPDMFSSLYRAYRDGRLADAQELQARINRFREFPRIRLTKDDGKFHFSKFKAGLDVLGIGGGVPAPPYRPVPREALALFRPFFEEAGVLRRVRETQERSPRDAQVGAPATGPTSPYQPRRPVADKEIQG